MERLPLPDALVAQARSYAEGGATPAEPRDAATVVLLRPGAAGPDVYLLRRQTSMAFAGGMCVFPGGGVDPRDFDDELVDRGLWAGPSPAEWASRLGCDEPKARALVCAAVRETFEESGVLLAGAGPDSVVADTTGDDWEADRVALESREVSLTAFLEKRVARAPHRPPRRLVGLADPGLRAAALPHLVLRGPAARGAGDPRRVERVVVGHVGRRHGRGVAGRAAGDPDAAPDVADVPGGRVSTPTPSPCSPRRAGGPSRCSCPRSSPTATTSSSPPRRPTRP